MSQIQGITLWVLVVIATLNAFLAIWYGGNWIVNVAFKAIENFIFPKEGSAALEYYARPLPGSIHGKAPFAERR